MKKVKVTTMPKGEWEGILTEVQATFVRLEKAKFQPVGRQIRLGGDGTQTVIIPMHLISEPLVIS